MTGTSGRDGGLLAGWATGERPERPCNEVKERPVTCSEVMPPGQALRLLRLELAGHGLVTAGMTITRLQGTLTLTCGPAVGYRCGWLFWPAGRRSRGGPALYAAHWACDPAGAAHRLAQPRTGEGEQDGAARKHSQDRPAIQAGTQPEAVLALGRPARSGRNEDASATANPSNSSPSAPDGTPAPPMPPGATMGVGEQAAGQELARLRAQLTEREMHVLAALCDLEAPQETSGATPTARQIAAGLTVAVGTVRAHLLHMYWKLGVPDGPERRSRLARKAMALGLADQARCPPTASHR